MASANEVEDVAELLTKTTVKPINIVRLSEKGLKLDTVKDVAVVIKTINESKDVQALSLEGNTLGVEAAQGIAEALSKRPEFERALWNDMFTGRLRSEIPIALESLGDAVISAHAQLTELDLCDNAFGPDGVKAVTKLLTSPSCFSLQVLKFNNNGLGIGGGKILSQALLECHKASVEAGNILKLRVFVAGRNRLENEGAAALAESFKVIGSLEEISLPQNGINHQGVSALAKAFKSNKHLKVINLNDNIFTAKAAIAVAKVLPNLPDLEVINFGDCLVKPQGALAIGQALKENHFNLKELILAFGDINNDAAMCVVEAMENKKNLEKLDLNGNCFGEEGIESIRSKLKELHREYALGSLSEDEGEDDEEDDDDDEEDDDDDEDEDEEEEDEEEEEEEEQQEEKKEESSNGEEKEKQENKKEEEDVGVRSAEEFLLRPSLETFNIIPKTQRIDFFKQALKLHIADVNFLCKSFVQVSAVLKDNQENFAPYTDAILHEAFEISKEPETVVNGLLVQMGLLKSEDKIKPKTNDITGSLLALEHAVKQEYFPKKLALYFIAFLSKPNTLLDDGSSAVKNNLIQTLQLL